MKSISRAMTSFLAVGVLSVGMAAQTASARYDSDIQTRVTQLTKRQEFRHLQASTEDGIGTLSGAVDLYQRKLDAAKKVLKLDKVQGVRNLITVAGPSPAVREALTAVNFVQRLEDRPVDAGSNGVCSFVAYSSGHGEEVRSALAACVVQHGWSLLEVKPMALSLEDLFMRLVTKEERV